MRPVNVALIVLGLVCWLSPVVVVVLVARWAL